MSNSINNKKEYFLEGVRWFRSGITFGTGYGDSFEADHPSWEELRDIIQRLQEEFQIESPHEDVKAAIAGLTPEQQEEFLEGALIAAIGYLILEYIKHHEGCRG